MQAAEKAAMPGASAIDKKVNQELVPKILALNDPFQEVRSHIGSLTYEIEVSHSESSKDSLRKQIDELQRREARCQAARRTAEAHDEFRRHERPASGVEGREGRAAARARGTDEAGHRAAHQARSVSLGPHRRRQHRDHRRGAELARQIRYHDPPDPREGCGPGGPLRIVPPGHARAGDDHHGVDGRRGGVRQPSE